MKYDYWQMLRAANRTNAVKGYTFGKHLRSRKLPTRVAFLPLEPRGTQIGCQLALSQRDRGDGGGADGTGKKAEGIFPSQTRRRKRLLFAPDELSVFCFCLRLCLSVMHSPFAPATNITFSLFFFLMGPPGELLSRRLSEPAFRQRRAFITRHCRT